MKISSTVLLALLSTTTSAKHIQCNDRQRLAIHSKCWNCPDYTRAQNLNSICAANTCVQGQQITMKDGTCYTCQKGWKPDATNKICNPVVCTGNTIYSKDKSQCNACPNYQQAQARNTKCGKATCQYNQIYAIDGSCQNCPANQHATNKNSQCVATVVPAPAPAPVYVAPVQANCMGTMIRSMDGTYCVSCPLYTRAQYGSNTCAANICTTNQILQQDGQCVNCPYDRYPDYQQRSCVYPFQQNIQSTYTYVPQYVQQTCNAIQKIDTNGSCVTCPPYQRAQNNNQYCAADSCNGYQTVTLDGRCEDVAATPTAWSQPTAWTQPTTWTQPATPAYSGSCGTYQIDTWKGCSTCAGGYMPDSSRQTCVRSSMINFKAEHDELDEESQEVSITSEMKKNPLPIVIGSIVGILCLTLGTLRYVCKIRSQETKQTQESNADQEMTQSNDVEAKVQADSEIEGSMEKLRI